MRFLPLLVDFFENCVEGEGPVVEQTIKIDRFEGIEMESNVKVYLKQAYQQRVTIAAPQNIIDVLTTELNGGNWEIDFQGARERKKRL